MCSLRCSMKIFGYLFIMNAIRKRSCYKVAFVSLLLRYIIIKKGYLNCRCNFHVTKPSQSQLVCGAWRTTGNNEIMHFKTKKKLKENRFRVLKNV